MQRPITIIAVITQGAFRDSPSTGMIPNINIMPVITGIRASTVSRIFLSNKHVNIRIDSAAIPDKKITSEETALESI